MKIFLFRGEVYEWKSGVGWETASSIGNCFWENLTQRTRRRRGWRVIAKRAFSVRQNKSWHFRFVG